eukprot:TRINITY_DN535_c0_g2_i4.p1 TRINITY_DN535_c0_g2~~TRINITY_DN535_c0_g2_i4.p1  ORF type:complete len:377 (+),score=78.51 TRINITY_DN535_c0_g2_i4:64-1131(+)
MAMFKAARFAVAGAAGFSTACYMSQWNVVQADEKQRVWPPIHVLERPANQTEYKGATYFSDGIIDKAGAGHGLSATWKPYRLEEVLPINHNTSKFVFSFTDPDETYSLPMCSTIELGVKLSNGKAAHRLYTPITSNGSKGGFECIIKHYQHGCFTPALFGVKEGEFVLGRMKHLKHAFKPDSYDHVGCIAAGTGIAPILQVIRGCLQESDHTKVSLLFSNRRQGDILVKEELDNLAKKYPDRFKVVHILQRPPVEWTGETGRLTHQMIAKYLPAPTAEREAGKKTLIAVSGPDKLMEIVAGCNPGNTAVWRNGNDLTLASERAKQVSCPNANIQGSMRQGILAQCGYDVNDVYRF